MATFVAERAFAASSSSPSTLSPSSNCTAGNTLVLVVASIGANNGGVSQVSDTKGNTWTVDAATGNNGGVAICSTRQDVGALATTDTVTVTYSGTVTSMEIWLEEWQGAYVADTTAASGGTTGTSVSTGTSGVTAGTDEFVVAVMMAGKSGGGVTWTWTTPTGYSQFTTTNPEPSGKSTSSAAAWHKENPAVGNQSATSTVGGGSPNRWWAALVAYKPSTGSIKTISGSPAGVATVSGTIVRTRVISASPTGRATVSGTIVRTRVISAAPNGVATVTAPLVRIRALTPVIHGVATVSSAVVRIRALSPTSAGVATVSAAVVRIRSLLATINGVASMTGSISVGTKFFPSTTGRATVSAAVVRTRVIGATLTASATVAASLVRTRVVGATATGSATVSAALTKTGGGIVIRGIAQLIGKFIAMGIAPLIASRNTR